MPEFIAGEKMGQLLEPASPTNPTARKKKKNLIKESAGAQ